MQNQIAYAGWSLPEVRLALDGDELLYAGKYSAPDYELVLEKEVQLAAWRTKTPPFAP